MKRRVRKLLEILTPFSEPVYLCSDSEPTEDPKKGKLNNKRYINLDFISICTLQLNVDILIIDLK